MKQRKIGTDNVGAVGLGCMGMSWAYGASDASEAVKVLARSLELGVNHWDTADLYGAGENEKLLATALVGKRDQVFLATKFGNVYDASMTTHQDQVEQKAAWIVDGTPGYARKAMDLSLQRLGVDHLDLYYLHRVDEFVPIEETVGAMADLVKAGKTRFIGLSEASAVTIRRAHKVHPIAAIQSEFSLWTQEYLHDVVPLCAELGIAFVPYSPLGRGFLTGMITSPKDLAEDDWRRMNPRFQGDNFEKNFEIVHLVEEIARRLSVPASEVALAWVLSKGSHICPIPGTKRVRYLEQNAAAADLYLSGDDLAILDNVPLPVGTRYPAQHMSRVNI